MSNDLMSKKKRAAWWLAFFLFGLLVVIDQIAKILARNVYKNHDFAFSLKTSPYLMYFVYAAILVAIVFYLVRSLKWLAPLEAVSWLLILAGGVSNLVERIALGYVRDFIYILTGVFNLADFYIILGVAMLLIRELIIKKRKLTQ